MTVADSCLVDAFHRGPQRFELAPWGAERGWPARGQRCPDCGVRPGGRHHPGCDIQRCPSCGGQLFSCGCRFDEDAPDEADLAWVPQGVDGSGALVELRAVGGLDVIVHHDDLPERDITSVDGIPCTTPVRTLIDLAPELERSELERVARSMLDRRLCTVDEVLARLAEPDMVGRPGAELLRRALPR